MNYSDVCTFKTLGNNPYEKFYEKIVRIQPRGDTRSISGKVTVLTDRHLTLQHKDGRETVIRLSEIAVITETSHREAV
jgi:ribosomal protein S1